MKRTPLKITQPQRATFKALAASTFALTCVASFFAVAQEAKPPAAPAATAGAPASGTAAPGVATPAAQPPAPVEVHTVGLGNVMDEVSATGTVKANESVMIRPEIVGRIAKIIFKDGDSVCRNQVLVELDTSLQQAEKDQSQAELNLAISNFKRNEELAAKNFVSSRVKEEAEAQVKVAQAKLALSEARFQRALVRAPFNGVLGLRNVSVGEYVKDGTDLVTLDDLSRLRVDFKLPERYAAQAKVGMKVMVEPDAALKLRGLGGKVDSIDSVLDTNGRALTLRVRIPNPKNVLKPGMFVKTKLVLSEREGAVMVPDETVSAQGRDMIVYKAVDGKAVRTVVKTGVRQLGKIEITEGLKAGDVIIQAGLQRINRDGQPIKVIESRATKPDGVSGKPTAGNPAAPKVASTAATGKPATAQAGSKPELRTNQACPPDGSESSRGQGTGAPRGPRKAA